MAASEAVRIRQLRVRGPAGAREQAARALQQAPWPAAPTGEVLILRRLELAATAHDLGSAAAAQARALALRAVDGWSAAAADAPAVRFASRAQLLACLARDLLAGRAHGLWYWSGWRELFDLPPAAATALALAREPLQLPAALAALEGSPPAWERFWAELPEAQARQLLGAVQLETGWPAAEPPAQLAPAAPLPEPEAAGPLPAGVLPRLPDPPGDPAAAPVRLAALLVAWTARPHRLDQPGAGAWLDALARQIAGAPASPPLAPTPRPPAGSGAPPPAAAARSEAAPPKAAAGPHLHAAVPERRTGPPEAEAPQRPAARPPTAAPDPGAQGPEPSDAKGDAESPFAPPPPPSAERSGEPGLLPDSPPEAHPESPGSSPEPSWNFLTAHGGLFYLLNFLRVGAVQRRLAADPQPLAGWRWLLATGRVLGLDPDPPLARFLAAQLALDHPAELHRLPPLPWERALGRLGRRRLGTALWNARLLRVDALVRADRSHLDVHCRMADVRLAVRRAGLDVDPGWLPWLGRVVRLHYDDPPELGPAA